MEESSHWSALAVIVPTIAAAVTAWMAVETRRMAKAASSALELEQMPILGLRNIQVEVSTTQSDESKSDDDSEHELCGIRVGVELFNAGRVPVRYWVNSLSVSFANRVPESENYLSRSGRVLPGASTVFWHSGIALDPPITQFPNKGRISIDCEYADDAGERTKVLTETLEFTLSGAAPGARHSWLHVDDATSA